MVGHSESYSPVKLVSHCEHKLNQTRSPWFAKNNETSRKYAGRKMARHLLRKQNMYTFTASGARSNACISCISCMYANFINSPNLQINYFISLFYAKTFQYNLRHIHKHHNGWIWPHGVYTCNIWTGWMVMNATPHTSFRHYGSLVQSGCDASRESDLMKWNERKQQQLQRHNTKSIDCMHEPQNNYEVKEQKKTKTKI